MGDVQVSRSGGVPREVRRTAAHVCDENWGRTAVTYAPPSPAVPRDVGLVRAVLLGPDQEAVHENPFSRADGRQVNRQIDHTLQMVRRSQYGPCIEELARTCNGGQEKAFGQQVCTGSRNPN